MCIFVLVKRRWYKLNKLVMTEFQEQVKNLVEQGKTQAEICKILNRATSSVGGAIKSLGLTPKKAYINTVDGTYWNKIDSDSKAYLLGFFIADGSVTDKERSHGRFSFSILEEDRYILEHFAKELHCSTNVVHLVYQNGVSLRQPQARLRWTSKQMLDDLKKFNLGPRKGNSDFKFPFEKIPKEYLGALIRGFIDGDGSFEQHNGVFNPIIVGPNKTWLEDVGKLVTKQTGLTYKMYEHKGKTCNYWSLRWKADSIDKPAKIKKLYNFLYDGAEIWMKRKRQKIEAYLEYRANQVRIKGIWRCNA